MTPNDRKAMGSIAVVRRPLSKKTCSASSKFITSQRPKERERKKEEKLLKNFLGDVVCCW